MNFKFLKITASLFLLIGFLIIFISSILHIYESRTKIKGFFAWKVEKYNPQSLISTGYKTKKELANDIISNGGYILLFRHAEREKWIDVKKYDAMEVLNNLKGENEYCSKAVGLNDRGLIQARAMGEIIDNINLPYHVVASSPSCRARQTAELAFGGYDYIKNIFMHYGPFDEHFGSDEEDYNEDVKNEILKIEVKENSNAIISAHNAVIRSVDIFDKIETNTPTTNIRSKFIEEGGFIVLRNDNGKLVFVELFYSFQDFYMQLFRRPKN